MSRNKESPAKGYESQRKMAQELWKAYFKNPLEDTVQSTNKESGKKYSVLSGERRLNDNIKKLKDGFLRLPNMMRKIRAKKEV